MIFTFVACNAPSEKEYTLSLAVDSSFNGSKQTNVAVAIVFDKEGKIVKAAFDSFEGSFGYNNGELVAVESVSTKIEQGEAYCGTAAPDYLKMPAGSWEKQSNAFVDAIIGKTAAEVEALDLTLIAGCTMQATTPVFKTLVKKAADYDAKVSFKTAEEIKLGFDINAKVSGDATAAKVAADYAAVVLAGDKVAACMIDSSQNDYTLAVSGEGENAVFAATALEYKGTKNELGDGYSMPNGSWKKQAQAYADSAVGKTVAELANLETVSDALAEAGCTMQNTTGGYKTTIGDAASKVK